MQHTTIPTLQHAALVAATHHPVQLVQVPVAHPDSLSPGECLVRVRATGVCHTDLHAAHGDWPIKPALPLIGGHEGVGTIVAIAKNTPHSPVAVGQRVGIKWIAFSCRNCEQCRKGHEQHCEKVKLSGYTVDGTFQHYLVSYVHCVTPIPDNLDDFAAASLLCAGLTVYRALKYSDTSPGDWVVVPGAGGGLGHLAIQYAKYIGLRVIAIDSGEEKQKLCKDLGADHWIDFKQSKDLVGDIKNLTDGRGAHATVVTTASSSGYTQAIEYLRENGRLMAVGMPGTATLDASIFFTVVKGITIHGSYVGNRQDAIECVQIAATGAVKVIYQKKKLSDLPQIYDDLANARIAGRVVLSMD